MQKYIGIAIKKDVNNPLPLGETPAVNVDVFVNLTTGPLATIYSDNGLTPITQPLKTDANGRFEFYAANGRYNITYDLPSGQITDEDILLDDPADETLTGEANTSSNAGAGVQLALPKSGVDLPFRTLLAGAGVTLTQNANEILIEVNVASFKAQSTETTLIVTTPLVITPPSGGRICIENFSCGGTNTNNTFSIDVSGSTFIGAGTKTLAGGSSEIFASNLVRVGNNSGNGGFEKWCFGVDEVVTINKGAGSNIICSYTVEVPDV